MQNNAYCPTWMVLLAIVHLDLAVGAGGTAIVDGNFRAASISWQAVDGNTVEIHLQSEWQRSYTGYTEASTGKFILGPSQAVIGDVVRISGRVPPRLFFGDDKFTYLDVQVTSYSADQDWFRGNTTLRHTYPTPNFKTGGWKVSVQGCCRIGAVLNNAGMSWSVYTLVDLQRRAEFPALSSPMVASISAPYRTVNYGEQKCELYGEAFNLPGTCTKFAFVNRDQCPAHIFLGPSAAEQARSGAAGVANPDPSLLFSLVEVHDSQEFRAVSGAPAIGNAQTSAIQVFYIYIHIHTLSLSLSLSLSLTHTHTHTHTHRVSQRERNATSTSGPCQPAQLSDPCAAIETKSALRLSPPIVT